MTILGGLRSGFLGLVCAGAGLMATGAPARAADHGDTPSLTMAARNDVKITDLHVFQHDGRLVISLCLNPAVPVALTDYLFASDITATIMIDCDGPVSFTNAADRATYGGTVMNPAGISDEIKFEISFPDGQNPQLYTYGVSGEARDRLRLFTGLRDDPFIRGGRQGRNVAAMVIDMPLSDVLVSQNTVLVWATTRVPDLMGPFQELGGRALRSMFPENDAMNSMHPSGHTAAMGVPPDVVIFDTSLPASFPNGRELADDVVNLVGDPRVLNSDGPTFPSANDVPFLAEFPYLGLPHGVTSSAVPAVSPWAMLGLGACLTLLVGWRASRGEKKKS